MRTCVTCGADLCVLMLQICGHACMDSLYFLMCVLEKQFFLPFNVGLRSVFLAAYCIVVNIYHSAVVHVTSSSQEGPEMSGFSGVLSQAMSPFYSGTMPWLVACLLAVAHVAHVAAVSHGKLSSPDLDDDVPKFETLEYAVAIGPGGEAEFRSLETWSGMI